jgi:hypothetical protein
MFGRKKLLARIGALEAQVRRLENMHATILPYNNWELPSFISLSHGYRCGNKVGYYNGRQLTNGEISLQPYHPQPEQVDYSRITNVPTSAVDTDRIRKVTLRELARLVIDGTPIKREEKVVSKRISEYTEDTTTTITIPE